jgi:hypothetical protein
MAKVPAFILMLAGGWNGEKKGVKCLAVFERFRLEPSLGGSRLDHQSTGVLGVIGPL